METTQFLGPSPSRSNLAKRQPELAPDYSSSASTIAAIVVAVALGSTGLHLSLLVPEQNYCQTRAKARRRAAAYWASDSFVATTVASSANERKCILELGVAMIVATASLGGIGKAARSYLEEVLHGAQLNNLEACFELQAPQLPSE